MIDAHIHLQDNAFAHDRPAVIKRATEAGVTGFFCAATSSLDWTDVLELSFQYPDITPFIGTHPWYAEQQTYDSERLTDLLKRHKNAGVGEIGLDALKGPKNQDKIFKEQLKIAAQLERPCVIHCVKSFEEMRAIIKNAKELPPAMLFHSFSGTPNDIKFFAGYGAYFSYGGKAFSPKYSRIRDLIAQTPKDRLLIETDAPNMMPEQNLCARPDDERNLPENLPLLINAAAELLGVDPYRFQGILDRNAYHFYKRK